MTDLETLRDGMRRFTSERDWERFHDPKSLFIALTGEVGEVAELLQWLDSKDAAALVAQEPLHSRLSEELADVLLYLIRLADVSGIDLAEASQRKLELNSTKHPPPARRPSQE